jgi:MoxR-like ATPase
MARRIHIVGGSGVGKTTLARRLGELLDLPVYDLDEVARRGGGRGPETTDAERADSLRSILARSGWITEGVHLGWTKPLLQRSDVIIWLDGVGVGRTRGRILKRFVAQAIAEARARRGRERILRFRDYAAQLKGLVVHIRDVGATPPLASAGLTPAEARDSTSVARAVEPYLDRVVRLTTQAEAEALIEHLSAGVPRRRRV